MATLAINHLPGQGHVPSLGVMGTLGVYPSAVAYFSKLGGENAGNVLILRDEDVFLRGKKQTNKTNPVKNQREHQVTVVTCFCIFFNFISGRGSFRFGPSSWSWVSTGGCSDPNREAPLPFHFPLVTITWGHHCPHPSPKHPHAVRGEK